MQVGGVNNRMIDSHDEGLIVKQYLVRANPPLLSGRDPAASATAGVGSLVRGEGSGEPVGRGFTLTSLLTSSQVAIHPLWLRVWARSSERASRPMAQRPTRVNPTIS